MLNNSQPMSDLTDYSLTEVFPLSPSAWKTLEKVKHLASKF
jgi:hypothetical protein